MQRSPVLHDAASVLSFRHGLTWVLLALSAGAVNAGAFLWADRFVSHVTGAATRLGTGSWSAVLESAFLLLAFILGAVASVRALQARTLRGLPARHALPLVVTSALVSGVALVGHTGFASSEGRELILLGVLGFAMGLMNASVASSTALAVRTTHMTGPASDFGVNLGVAFFASGAERVQALEVAALRGTKVLGFVAGALLMVPLAGALGSLALVAPAACILLAAHRSFGLADLSSSSLTTRKVVS